MHSQGIRKLTEEANEGGMAEGGSRAVQPMPTKSDLQAAFVSPMLIRVAWSTG